MNAKQGMVACAIGVFFAAGLSVAQAPDADAICGSIGGRHVDVSGCSDPLYELNDALAPPPPPLPNVSVCAGFGRRVTVSGCV